ncbi:hypothetical protein CALCODRAFT_407714, partial [Calocera cornea HHB12733]
PSSTSLTHRARGLFRKGLGTATRTWVGFGRADPKSWKHRLYSAGQRIYKRIDFEELALAGIEPALGPAVGRDTQGLGERALREAGERGERRALQIPLLYPPSHPAPLPHLQQLVAHRAPSHRRSLTLYCILMPLTAPFALVPVIPNIPFFYCAWRAWGHYRAYRAATYLDKLINSHTIVPTPSPLLDKLYAGFPSLQPTLPPADARAPAAAASTPSSASPASSASSSSSPSPSPSSSSEPQDPAAPYLLLNTHDIRTLIRAFALPEESATELEIALAQARARVG